MTERPPEFTIKQAEATAALAKYDEMRAKLLDQIRELQIEVYTATDLPPAATRIQDLSFRCYDAGKRAKAIAATLEAAVREIQCQIFTIDIAFMLAKCEDIEFLKHCIERGG